MQQIQHGESIIEAELNTGYESRKGFRDALSKSMEVVPENFKKNHNILKSSWLNTKLGTMLTIADEHVLYLLEFLDGKGLEREVAKLKSITHSVIIPGETDPIVSIQRELTAYFEGNLKNFETPLHFVGSTFQQLVWNALMDIPYGETRSYADQATMIGKSSAFRAVANANGANQMAIVIPCHRIINTGGGLGGYAGGLMRKRWLIEHEARNK